MPSIQVVFDDLEVTPVSSGKAHYEKLLVHYSENGASRKTSLLSFKVPSLTDFLKNTPKGSVIEVDLVQAGDYLNWVGAKMADAAAPQATKSFAAPKSNYETPDERAYRQVLIVRQSCLAQAVQYCNGSHAENWSPEAVTDLAQQFVDWVFSGQESQPQD